jgi:hypothetical protein
MVAHRKAWWHIGRCCGSNREALWLIGSVPDSCLAVPGPYPVPPQPTADCQSFGGLPPWMALGCGLTSVRGNRGENYENEPLVCKNLKKKKNEKDKFKLRHDLCKNCTFQRVAFKGTISPFAFEKYCQKII